MPGASEAMDQPVKQVTITDAVRDALRLTREHDDARLIGVSRECQRKLRAEPSVERLDRCAAFDDAVLQIQNHDAMWDRGPFSQSAVTTRQWSSASALSNDYLAVDGRLDRIRLAVELALAPPEPVQPARPSD
jgi:hypothetical protein